MHYGFRVLDKMPEPPKELNELARKIYFEKGNEAIEKGYLTEIDLYAFRMYCSSYSLMEEAYKAVKEKGMMQRIVDENGNLKSIPNPYVSIYNDSLRSVKNLGPKFFFSDPEGRSFFGVARDIQR